jgi:hypothetical protein
MILTLRIIFSLILLTMIVVTSWASMHESILKVPATVTGDPWFIATMFDAYFGFTTFFLWVCYKEKSSAIKAVWFVLIMALGNAAMASYVLIKIWRQSRADKDLTVKDLLCEQAA